MLPMCILTHQWEMKIMLPYRRNSYRSDVRGWIQEQHFTLNNFSGGLNNVEPDNEIADNESTDTRNMRFLDDTVMEKRPGIVEFSSLDMPVVNEDIVFLDKYSHTLGNSELVIGTASYLYIGNDKKFPVEGKPNGVSYIGKYYFVDGRNLYVYDGTECYRIINAPIGHLSEKHNNGTTTLKLKSIPAQLKVGDPVMILAISLNKDSNFTSTVSSIDEENKTVTIAAGITGDAIATTPVFFYTPKSRLVSGIETVIQGEEVWNKEDKLAYYLPCSAEIADNYAGESYMPDSPNLICTHKSRLFISGDSEQPHGVYMSRTNQPLYFPSGAGITVKPNGDSIVDMFVFDDALIIGRKTDLYVLYGRSEYQNQSTDPFYIKQMDASCGFMNKDCGAILNNFYIFFGSDGRFYKLHTPTTYVEYLMTSPLPHKCDVYSKPFGVVSLDEDEEELFTPFYKIGDEINVSATAYRNEIYFSFYGYFTVVYNYENMAYTYFIGWHEKNTFVYNSHLIMSTQNKVMKYTDNEPVYNDDGAVIECRYHTKRYSFVNPISYKYFKQFLVTSQSYDKIKSNISVVVEVDMIDIDVLEDISSNKSRWDSSNFNIDVFNNRELYKSQFYNLDVRGRSIKFHFSNTFLDESMRLYDLNILYGLRDVR